MYWFSEDLPGKNEGTMGCMRKFLSPAFIPSTRSSLSMAVAFGKAEFPFGLIMQSLQRKEAPSAKELD